LSVPIIILGGRDRGKSALPDEGRDKHKLTGYKGVDIHFQGRPLVENLLERLVAAGGFAPIYLAGPARIYRPFADQVAVIDTDGTFGQNLETSIEHVRKVHGDAPIAFITCDVLPEVSTLAGAYASYVAARPCDVWYPMIRIPADRSRLGASAWKPTYKLITRKGEPPVEVLPGHLIVVDPTALRLAFLYNLLEIAYRTRNRSIHYRLVMGVGGVLARLVYQDLKHVLTLRVPDLTWSVLRAVIPGADALNRGTLTLDRGERAFRTVFVKARHRRNHPSRRAMLPIMDGLSLALDIDTEEEARAMGGDVRPAAGDAGDAGDVNHG
jgi:hypothetical protein